VIKKGRKTKGFGEVSAYMFGDDIAMKRGYSPVGLSVNAGNFVQINVNNIDKRTKRKSVYEKSLIKTRPENFQLIHFFIKKV